MSLPGKSKTITVEPIKTPVTVPISPTPEREPITVPDKEKVPA